MDRDEIILTLELEKEALLNRVEELTNAHREERRELEDERRGIRAENAGYSEELERVEKALRDSRTEAKKLRASADRLKEELGNNGAEMMASRAAEREANEKTAEVTRRLDKATRDAAGKEGMIHELLGMLAASNEEIAKLKLERLEIPEWPPELDTSHTTKKQWQQSPSLSVASSLRGQKNMTSLEEELERARVAGSLTSTSTGSSWTSIPSRTSAAAQTDQTQATPANAKRSVSISSTSEGGNTENREEVVEPTTGIDYRALVQGLRTENEELRENLVTLEAFADGLVRRMARMEVLRRSERQQESDPTLGTSGRTNSSR